MVIICLECGSRHHRKAFCSTECKKKYYDKQGRENTQGLIKKDLLL